MSEKLSASELVELALIYGIQDRESFAGSYSEGPEREEALDVARQMRTYYKKRFKKSFLNDLERIMSEANRVSIFDLMKEPIT